MITMSDPQSTPPTNDPESGVTITAWREYSHTLRDGWRLSGTKTTVSVTIDSLDGLDAGFALEGLAEAMDRTDRAVFDAGVAEADRRNSFDTVTLEQAS
jgi:hypothetical protein